VAVLAAVSAVVWGVAAFGAVYEWGQIVLASLCLVAALSTVKGLGRHDLRLLLIAAPLLVAVGLQILPLPASFVHPIAHQHAFSGQLESSSRSLETISIARDQTGRALLWLCVLTVLTIAISSALRGSRSGLLTVTRGVAITGCVIALEGIVQSGAFNGKIYWFWESDWRAAHNYFGPFVNRNHFAGWMILALSVTAGWLAVQITKTSEVLQPLGWRYRLLRIASGEGTVLWLTATAVLTMYVAVVWTMSRSGIAGATLSLAVLSAAALYKMRGRGAGIASAALVGVIIGSAFLLKGPQNVAEWYGTTNTLEWRFELWKNSIPMLREAWVLGFGLNTYGNLTWVYPTTHPVPHAYEAHNDYLQLAVEGGLLVVIPALLVAAMLASIAFRRLRLEMSETAWWIRMGAIAGICGLALQEITDFSLQIPGVATLFAVVVAIAIHPVERVTRASGRIMRMQPRTVDPSCEPIVSSV
jgi:O-antigen ligase